MRRRGGRWKLAAAALLAVLLAAVLTAMAQLRPIMDSMSTARVSNVIHKAVAEAVSETIATGRYDYTDLIRLEKDEIDTLALCRALMPAGERKNLSSACRYFGIDQENAHRALSDALCAHRLYQKLKEQYPEEENGLFLAKKLRYKAKKERTASKRQKEYLQDLIKYHRINVTVQMEHMSGNEISRMTDKIIFTYGKIPRETRGKQSPDK